ncbi:DUF447 domain-containing protein [Moorella sulfitireducens]|uniref:DUF447 domain-containing protein n=1 Tax=Neomoorella sulfitireducens TaxID=2972948 RepID=UPI0021ACF1B7|nr:DUF447 domain-containing protein [Moorella sulfitireducens]
MILEAIVSTISPAGEINFAPVGVRLPSEHGSQPGRTLAGDSAAVEAGFVPPGQAVSTAREDGQVELHLYRGSRTYANLLSTGEGVICFIDDVLLFVETALFSTCPSYVPSLKVRPPRLAGSGTVWEFKVSDFNVAAEPARVTGRIVHRGEGAGFRGFCRAQFAVLEAAIAATRWQWLAPQQVASRWDYWQQLVVKTGGAREFQAFSLVHKYLEDKGFSLPLLL